MSESEAAEREGAPSWTATAALLVRPGERRWVEALWEDRYSRELLERCDQLLSVTSGNASPAHGAGYELAVTVEVSGELGYGAAQRYLDETVRDEIGSGDMLLLVTAFSDPQPSEA